MPERILRDAKASYDAWIVDQLAKSELFHQKLHEWQLLEVANRLEQIKGETLEWNSEQLQISEDAWNKVIHRAIKPIIVFAHPVVLTTVPRAVGYYRMLSMVSQKSMSKLGLNVGRYESSDVVPDQRQALRIAQRLNEIISYLVQSDEAIDAREFDIWRGMAAGSQAQGSWLNVKGKEAEIKIKVVLRQRLRDMGLVIREEVDRVTLSDGRVFAFASEPDVAVYQQGRIQMAMEIKGGIDTAGVLERIGAAVKSLSRVKDEHPGAITLLFLPAVSVTLAAENALILHSNVVDSWFTTEAFLHNESQRDQIFTLLRI